MEFDPAKPVSEKAIYLQLRSTRREKLAITLFNYTSMNTQPTLPASKAFNEKKLERLIAAFVQQVNELNDMSLQHVSIYLHGKEGCFNELPPEDIAKPLENNVTYREIEVAAPVHNRIYLISRG